VELIKCICVLSYSTSDVKVVSECLTFFDILVSLFLKRQIGVLLPLLFVKRFDTGRYRLLASRSSYQLFVAPSTSRGSASRAGKSWRTF